MSKTIHILSTRAVQGALPGLIAAFEGATGATVTTSLGPTTALLKRIKDGARADAAILTREGVAELAAAGILDAASAVDLVHSVVGLAVKAGAPSRE